MAIMNKCKNFLAPDKCDDRIIGDFEKNLEAKDTHDNIKVSIGSPLDYKKADMICSECQNFK